LPNDIKMNSDCFVTNILIPLEQAIFSRWRPPHQKWLVTHLDNCSIHKSTASTDWFEEYGMRRMPCLLYLPDLAPVTSTCFLQWKKNSNGFRWLTKTNVLSPCKRFWRYRSRRIEWRISGLGAADSRSKSRQRRLRQIINKFYLYWLYLILSDRADACIYRPDDKVRRIKSFFGGTSTA
jgi:hypothetical protein